jgi:hypothetical protein
LFPELRPVFFKSVLGLSSRNCRGSGLLAGNVLFFFHVTDRAALTGSRGDLDMIEEISRVTGVKCTAEGNVSKVFIPKTLTTD